MAKFDIGQYFGNRNTGTKQTKQDKNEKARNQRAVASMAKLGQKQTEQDTQAVQENKYSLKIKLTTKDNKQLTLKPTIPTTEKVKTFSDAIDYAQLYYPDIELDPSQRRALELILQNQYCCLIGSAGTGKTTVQKFVLRALLALPMYKRFVPKVAAVSFTGRASQVLSNHLIDFNCCSCQTIHSLLEFRPVDIWDDEKQKLVRTFEPERNAENKLDHVDILIMDEAGTVGLQLWKQLIAALHPHTRIIMAGDIQQLPTPIGRSILGFAMNKWPLAGLETIHRQADGNPIIDNAYRILNGQPPVAVRGKIMIMPLEQNVLAAGTQIVRAVAAMHKKKLFDLSSDAIIVPTNVGILGQESLNKELRDIGNPVVFDKEGRPKNPLIKIKIGNNNRSFAIGDRVMATQNDNQTGITNGMQGIILEIGPNEKYQPTEEDMKADIEIDADAINAFDFDTDNLGADIMPALGEVPDKEDEIPVAQRQCSHYMTVKFTNGVEKTLAVVGDYNNLQYAYATTCHKMQGSECKKVIIVIHSQNNRLFCREWLYTAITRAQEQVILMINDSRGLGLTACLTRQKIKGATLKEKAQSFVKFEEEAGKLDRKISINLPENSEISKSIEEEINDLLYENYKRKKENLDNER